MSEEEGIYEHTHPLPLGFLTLHLHPLALCPWAPLLLPQVPPLLRKRPRTQLFLTARQEKGGEVHILFPEGELHIPPRAAPVLLTQLIHRLIARLLPPASLHGALAGTEEAALLFLGPSGRGKTTLVRELMKRGYRWGSDEFLCLSRQGIIPLPRALEWEGDLPPLPGTLYRNEEYEYTLFLPEAGSLPFVPFAAVRAILYLEEDRVGPYLLPLSRLPDEVWIRAPILSQFFDLYRLFSLPLYSLFPGEVEESANFLCSFFEDLRGRASAP